MDFNFDALFENSERLRNHKDTSDDISEYFDDYYDDDISEVDSDDEWMAEYRLSKMQQSEKEEFNVGLTDVERQSLISSGKQLFLNTFQRINRMDEKYYKAASVRPIPADLVTTEKVEQIESFFENEYQTEDEEINSSVDPNLLDFRNDTIIRNTVKLVRNLYEKLGTDEASEFQNKYTNFLNHFRGWKFKYHRINFFNNISSIKDPNHRQLVNNILNFQDPNHRQLNNVFIVYVPSGGGKTTMFKKFKNFVNFLDVDDFIKNNYDSFKVFQTYYNSLNNVNKQGLMNLWFKYELHRSNLNNQINNVIMLFNHPNQLPNYFRRTYNELIIIPSKLNWSIRFFEENIFSLLHVKNKHVVFLEYKTYLSYIFSLLLKFFPYSNVRKMIKKQIYGIKSFNEDNSSDNVQQIGYSVGTKRKGRYNLRDTKPKDSKKVK